MPFNKRKQQQAKELDNKHLQELQRIDAAIDEADRIKDPAEKLLKLGGLRSEVGAEISRENHAIYKKADNAAVKVLAGGAGVSAAAAAGATVVTIATGGVGMFVFIPLLAGSLIASNKRADSVTAKLKEKVAGRLEKQGQQQTRISEMMDAVVDNNVEEIAKSPLYGDVLALPGLAEKFAEAASKYIATPKEPDAEAASSADDVPKKMIIKKNPGNNLK